LRFVVVVVVVIFYPSWVMSGPRRLNRQRKMERISRQLDRAGG
jgi:hypothetical protein